MPESGMTLVHALSLWARVGQTQFPACWVHGYDSIPMIIICGQVRQNIIADYSKVRQIGPQEGNNLAMAKRLQNTPMLSSMQI